MALSRQERRALREIEQLLAAEDPALAILFRRAGTPRSTRLTHRIVTVVITVAVVLLLGGLFLGEPGMVSGGLLMLIVLPPGLWLATLLPDRDP